MNSTPPGGLADGDTANELPDRSESGLERADTSVDVPSGGDVTAVAGMAEEIAHEKLVESHGDTTAGINEAVGAAAHVAHVLGISAHDAGKGALRGAVHGSGRSGDDSARVISESARSLVAAAAEEHEDVGEFVDGAIDAAIEIAAEIGMDPANAVAAAMAGALHGARDAGTKTFEKVAAAVRKREHDADADMPTVEPITEYPEE